MIILLLIFFEMKNSEDKETILSFFGQYKNAVKCNFDD